MEKQKILIVDDSAMNRMLLEDILEEQYDVMEAEDGMQALEILAENESDFWLVLLDIMMPEMDGFDVLNHINKHYWNDRIVVMMISSDGSPENINHAYSLGAFDYISRPFDPLIVRKRIANTLYLYARQHDLENAMKEQFYEQQKNNELMITILSHIVEFRNGESGVHIQHVKIITELLLKHLVQLTDKYSLSAEEIALIGMASAIHDIGKISIPEEILNKPGRLTDEEFAVMKTHSAIGAQMLADLPAEQFESPLVKVAYEICRWHHERYDGRGYPDGLAGKDIPISAQVVAMADVYDALTSERCYKKAFSHEEALNMILEGKCGVFNPLLLQCLTETEDKLKKILDISKEREKGKICDIMKKEEENSKVSRKKEQEISAEQSGYMQLLYMDSLTNVFNRRYYKEHIQNVYDIEAAALIDVYNLKQINEDYGRDVGNLVLQYTAHRLSEVVRKSDYLIRYGGDEFLIVFNSMTKQTFEARLAEISRSLDTVTVDGYPELCTGVNIGGAYGTGNSEELFQRADDMLRQSKQTHKEVVICFLDEQESCTDNL